MNSVADTMIPEQGERLAPAGAKKQSTIEFWRFAFTVLVLIYHIELSYTERVLLLSGASAVEFFFILSGFLMAKSAYSRTLRRTEPMTVQEAHGLALDFVKKKLKAIYPILIVVMLFWAVGVLTAPDPEPAASFGGTGTGGGMWGGWGDTTGGGTWGDWGNFDWGNTGGGIWGNWGTTGGMWGAPAGPELSPFMTKLNKVLNTEYTMLLLIGSPAGFMSLNEAIPMWFLTALIIVGYFYTYAINKRYDIMAFLAPALGVLCWMFFGLSAMAGILDSSSKAGFLTSGMVKAISEMSFGVSMFMLYNYLSKKDLSRFWKVVLSLLEIYAIYRFCALTFYQPSGNNNYLRLIYIMIIVLLSFLNVTWISRLLNRPVFRWLGHITLAMYISHYFLKDFFLETILDESFMVRGRLPVSHMILYTLVVMAASVLIMLYIAFIKRWVLRPIRERREARARLESEAEPAVAGQ